MVDDIRAALDARPPHQRNDDPGRSGRGKREPARAQRVARTLNEPARSDVCMNMARSAERGAG